MFYQVSSVSKRTKFEDSISNQRERSSAVNSWNSMRCQYSMPMLSTVPNPNPCKDEKTCSNSAKIFHPKKLTYITICYKNNNKLYALYEVTCAKIKIRLINVASLHLQWKFLAWSNSKIIQIDPISLLFQNDPI